MKKSISFWKKILCFPLIVLTFLGIQDFCHKKTQGFTVAKARSFQESKEKKILPLEEISSLKPILNQPFYFLKKGLQCYVFLSEDTKYVLKLFRWKELEPSRFSKFLPSSWTKNSTLQKKKKQELDFASYQIAWEDLKEETGLIFLHLEKTEGLNSPLHLYDPILVHHVVPADDMEFIIQKKADSFLPYFEKNKTSSETLYTFFTQVAENLRFRLEKGISDSDISVEYNMGIYEGRPMFFDVGNLTKKKYEPSSFQKNLEYEARLILKWLAEKSPDLEIFFRNALYAQDSSEEVPKI